MIRKIREKIKLEVLDIIALKLKERIKYYKKEIDTIKNTYLKQKGKTDKDLQDTVNRVFAHELVINELDNINNFLYEYFVKGDGLK